MLGWINNANWADKYDFFRSLLNVLPPEEVKCIENMTKKMRRVCKRKKVVEKKSCGDESVPESVPVPPPRKNLVPIQKVNTNYK
jgi:hypothetical protein